ncbi:hypothetical protein EDB86DRAFT_2827162 [Lactarius hatsudake]|nr:hypothetical protein EDB86DRAFT_2827162 [Lactarius hatsudake]
MTDWKSPAVIAAEYFALIKLCHAMSGILFWEFVTNIGFEYSGLHGEAKVSLVIFGARWCPLFCVITILVGFDSVNQINCQAYGISVFLFAHVSIASASALIVLRVVAIWGLNKIATSIASIAWLANTGTLIHSVVVVHAAWSDSEGCCKITNPSETKINIPVTLVTDVVLLVLMLIGLLRWEYAHHRGGIWWLLYTQGLAWMIIVTLAEALITGFHSVESEWIVLTDAMNLSEQADWVLSTPLKPNFPRTGDKRICQTVIVFVMEPLASPKQHFRPGEKDEVW